MIELLRTRDRVSTPWKNGGGVTTELAIFPPGAGFDDFGWRVSIAEVRRGGPFSLFPGVDRCLAVLEGRMLLRIAPGRDIDLSPEAPPVGFPGEVACEAILTSGPVLDLNVMTRRDVFKAQMTRHRQSGALSLDSDPGINILVAAQRLTAVADGQTFSLEKYDALLVAQGECSRVTFSSQQIDLYRIKILPAY